jgi:antitoxin FitA
MTNSLIQKLNPESKARLRTRAKQHGRTIEAEAQNILESALASSAVQSTRLVDRIRARVVAVGGIELPTITRGPIPKPRFPEE